MTDIVNTDTTRFRIRQFRSADEADVVGVWRRSGRAAYTYLPTWPALTLETARTVFREVIHANCAIWVGTRDEQIVAYLAMNGSYLDRLYIDPPDWRQGWGTRLIRLAMELSPTKLELHTHQENHPARALYERHYFKAVKFGTSPPQESAPDVEYHWRP